MTGPTPKPRPPKPGPRVLAPDDPAIVAAPPPREDAAVAETPTADGHRFAKGQTRSGLRLGALALIAAGSLILAGLAVDTVWTIEAMIARAPLIGWPMAGLAALLLAALAGLAAREVAALARLDRLTGLQATARSAVATPAADTAEATLAGLERLYAGRADLAWALGRYRERREDAVDPLDRLALFEAEVLVPLDRRAVDAVAKSAGTTAVFTTLSPFVAVDMVVTGWRNLRLVREIAVLYGGRPGLAGAVAVIRRIVVSIALTGGLEASDGVIGQTLGGGLAGRVSARLGQGVVNGLLTARIGLGAITSVRPMPFVRARPARLADMGRAIAERLSLRLSAAERTGDR